MIDPTPYKFYLICSVPETFLIITLGLMFIGIQKKWSIILLTAFIQSTVMFVLMSLFNFNIHVFASYFSIVISMCIINKVNFKKGLVGIAFALSIGLLIKGTTALAFVRITEISFVEIFSRYYLRVAILIPYFIGLAISIALVKKYQFSIGSELQKVASIEIKEKI